MESKAGFFHGSDKIPLMATTSSLGFMMQIHLVVEQCFNKKRIVKVIGD